MLFKIRTIRVTYNVKLFYFSPNTTSKLQPTDQRMIKNLKVHYRKSIMTKTLAAMEKNLPLKNLISLRNFISLFDKVWRNYISETAIANCSKTAGFVNKGHLDFWEEDCHPLIVHRSICLIVIVIVLIELRRKLGNKEQLTKISNVWTKWMKLPKDLNCRPKIALSKV